MGSAALRDWQSVRSHGLDNLMAVHTTVTGGKQGRQWATEQLNHAVILRLASEFQGFSRDLHDEAITFILDIGVTANSAIETILRANLEFGRKLDQGNSNRSTLGNDFVRLGLPIVQEIKTSSAINQRRLDGLDRVNNARNATRSAHQDDRSSSQPEAGSGSSKSLASSKAGETWTSRSLSAAFAPSISSA